MAPSVDLPPNKSTRNSTAGQRTFVRTLEYPRREIERLIEHVPFEFQVIYHPEASEKFASILSPRSDKSDLDKYWDRLSPWSKSIVDQDRQSVLLKKSKMAKRTDSTKHSTLADTNADDGEVDVDYTWSITFTPPRYDNVDSGLTRFLASHQEDHVVFAPDGWYDSRSEIVSDVSGEISDEVSEEGMVRVRPQPKSLGPRQSWTACWMETPPGTWLAYSIDSETGRQNTTSEFDQLDFPAECYIRLTASTASEAEYQMGTLAPPQDTVSLMRGIRSRSEVGLPAIEEEDPSDDTVC
jgi:hypothetical protein